MKKYHCSYSTCAHVVQKNHDFIVLQVFSNIDAASLPQNVYYRVIAVREGGPRPGDASCLFGHATTPSRMYEGPVQRSGCIATQPVPPSRLTL